jgi:hemerythrin-like domain-containing protein
VAVFKKSDEVKDIMKSMKISDQDIEEIIDYAEQFEDLIFEPKENIFLAKKKIGERTIYIEYLKKDNLYDIRRIYFHKAIIKREG